MFTFSYVIQLIIFVCLFEVQCTERSLCLHVNCRTGEQEIIANEIKQRGSSIKGGDAENRFAWVKIATKLNSLNWAELQ